MPAASVTRPIRPSKASTSRTRWPLPRPPMAGLQDIAPMVSNRWVTSAVFAPMRAAAAAASQPAWPPPITMTSNDSRGVIMVRTSIVEQPNPEAVSSLAASVSRETARVPAGRLGMFHVKHFVNSLNEGILLSDTELPEDHIENVLDIDP